MDRFRIKYGRADLEFTGPSDRFQVLTGAGSAEPLTDVQIGKRIDSPIGSKSFEDVIEPGNSILFVVPDANRQSGSGQIVNLLVRRAIANGTMPFDIAVIFATGIHRSVTEEEKQYLLTPFIAQRVKTLDHKPRDLMRIVRMGETSGGIPIELDRALTEFDHTILIGGISFHYFAGFTGGRKLICPGLASARTIAATHKLAFDCEVMDRRQGVGPGTLDGNAVHEVFEEAASKVNVSFAVYTFVNAEGAVTDLFCGDRVASHREACSEYALRNTIEINEKRRVVVVSCGGWPHDINLIQAHKAIDAAAQACVEGGTIILAAECADGIGRDDFLDWFAYPTSSELGAALCQKYQVNGQTAWSLKKKTETFRVFAVSSLDSEVLERTGITAVGSLDEALSFTDSKASGYVIPQGAEVLISLHS